jgi:signal transduction histidine kinase
MRLRSLSIRLRILLLVAIPILSLIGVYAFAATITATDAINLARSRTLKDTIGTPTGNFEAQIDTERLLAVAYLAAPVPSNLATLRAQETRTQAAEDAFEDAAASSTGNASTAEKQAIAGLIKAADGLPALRSQIASVTISRPQAISAYDNVINSADSVLNEAILQENNVSLVTQTLALVRTGRSEDILLQEDALINGDAIARTFSVADRQQFTQLVGARRATYAQNLADLDPTYRAYYTRDVNPQALSSLNALEDKIISDNHPGRVPPVPLPDWNLAVGAVSAGLSNASTQAATEATMLAQPVANATFLRLYLVGGLGLLAVILSILISVWIGRGLVRQLAALRRSALDLATNRLPSVVERLRAGQDVDVSAEAPPLESSPDEIGQVREAFNAVQRTAVEAAVDEARLRRGVSDVFRNLARRSQSLLHRQLALLDAMERRASEPEELEDLFRIDHLTTRMRRHSEGLIILSGESPGRGWRNPVPFIDVLRAAVAEVEDYTRIRVTVGTPAALVGPAVADVIHMIAELAENATIYSPPNTPVRVHGDVVGRGFAVEIEDRGLGISEEKMAEINNNFAHPPQFDLSGSEQLGLFVAGQLAKRHDIRITLQGSPFGGTTAIVLIPKALVVGEGAYDGEAPALPTMAEHPIRLASRHPARNNGVIAEPAALTRPSALMPPAEPAPGDLPVADLPVADLPVADLPAADLRVADLPAADLPPADPPPADLPPADPPATGLPAADLPADLPAGFAADIPAPGRPSAEEPPSDRPPGPDTMPFAVPSMPSVAGDAGDAGDPGGPAVPATPSGTAPPPVPATPSGTAPPPVPATPSGTAPPATPEAQEESVFTPRRSRQEPATTGSVFSFGGQELDAYPDGSDTSEPRVDPAELARLGLPVRVRQASLAPQLRDRGTGADGGDRVASAPSPEAARSIMTALQRGWERGRYISGSVTPPSDPPPNTESSGNGGEQHSDQ